MIAIVTACIAGPHLRHVRETPARLELLELIVEATGTLAQGGCEALLLPAGYLRTRLRLGPLDIAARRRAIEGDDVGASCWALARSLWGRAGAVLVVGIETPKYAGFVGDHMLVAFGPDGVLASARKVFSPTDADPYLVFGHDAVADFRGFTLAGRLAVLSVCYDAFGFAEAEVGPTPKRDALAFVADPEVGWRWTTGEERGRWVREFRRTSQIAPAMALVGIHSFSRPGRELYWQRHGIATASAALGGALVVGAAHYEQRLPDPTLKAAGTLASVGAPRKHLEAGLRRKALGLQPERWAYVRDKDGCPSVLLRLFRA